MFGRVVLQWMGKPLIRFLSANPLLSLPDTFLSTSGVPPLWLPVAFCLSLLSQCLLAILPT